MANIKSSNVNKYDTGGGDNYIADGYIKSVEKVWIDSATMGTTALGSDDTVCIGIVPPNKKLLDVVVHMPALMSAASNTTVFVDSGTTILKTAGSTYLGAMQADGVAAGTDTYDSQQIQTLRLKGDKHATVTRTGSDTYLYLNVLISGGVDADLTGSTIRSIIKYT
jgi:hypothetical protein